MLQHLKRVANIIKDVDVNSKLGIDEDLFENDEEKELYTKYNQVKFKILKHFDEELEALFNLKPQLDNFFDNVFVNHENEKSKQIEKNLIGLVYQDLEKSLILKRLRFNLTITNYNYFQSPIYRCFEAFFNLL